jgi:hypothetical protein
MNLPLSKRALPVLRARTAASPVPFDRAILSVLVVSLTFGAFFVVRYFGYWSEQDTAVFSRVIADMQEVNSLRSPGGYTHGFAYPVWAATTAKMAGLSIAQLLQLYTPLVGSLMLGLFSFAAFRRLLGSQRRALLGTVLLFLTPELYFTVSRGNHEKFTVSLVLLAVLCLLSGFIEGYQKKRWRVFVSWTFVLYIIAFTLISLNIFFGSIFTASVTLILILTTLISRVRPKKGASLRVIVRRLVIVVSCLWLLFSLMVWYVYPQHGTNSRLISSAVENIGHLLGTAEPEPVPEATSEAEVAPIPEEPEFEASNPYSVGGTDWVSLPIFHIISLFRWTLLLGSTVTLLSLFVYTLRNLEHVTFPTFFLIGFCGALTVLIGIAIPIDFLNLSAGSNLQVRVYTYFSILAVPMLAYGISFILERFRPIRLRPFVSFAVKVALVGFAVLSLLKATLDPAISNRWTFYYPAEVQAAHFWNTRMQSRTLWIGAEGRMQYAYTIEYPLGLPNNNTMVVLGHTGTTHALYSPVVAASAVAWGRFPSLYWLENKVYDNGIAQVYHRLPETPFQR